MAASAPTDAPAPADAAPATAPAASAAEVSEEVMAEAARIKDEGNGFFKGEVQRASGARAC